MGIFTGKKYEDLCPTSHMMEAPIVTRTEYQLLEADASTGEVSLLLDDSGGTKNDVNLPTFLNGDATEEDRTVEKQILECFESGKTTTVTVLSACGQEKIVGAKTID